MTIEHLIVGKTMYMKHLQNLVEALKNENIDEKLKEQIIEIIYFHDRLIHTDQVIHKKDKHQ